MGEIKVNCFNLFINKQCYIDIGKCFLNAFLKPIVIKNFNSNIMLHSGKITSVMDCIQRNTLDSSVEEDKKQNKLFILLKNFCFFTI